MLTRLLAIAGALCAWTGLGLQLYLIMTGELGALGGLWRFFAFFTILTNIICAALLTQTALSGAISEAGARLRGAAAVYIVVVGMVYVTVLQATWNPQGLQLIADRLLHYGTPILFVLFWLFCVPKAPLRWRDAFAWLIYPALYLGYVLARAQFDGFYPYFFINLPEIGWTQFAINAAGLLAAFFGLGLLLIALAKAIRRP
ncbi:MAG: Pr6Pr family membrane protein [Hyphomonadaceae bacterium]